jgi:enoyl-CoA hydratase/carnithine racemase
MIENIKLSKDDGTLIITMARPEKKNALTNATYGVRADAITSFDADPAARVCSFQERATCTPPVSDLGAVASGQEAGDRHVFRFLRALAELSKPIVAAVKGRRSVSVGRC